MFRIGNGYDVHRLVAGRRLILGGVNIPYERGLLGHSDADVLTHAIMDSLLGACALKDIGWLFPDTDAKYKNADSIMLLEHVYGIVKLEGYVLSNLDSVIIAQMPKLSPYIDSMRAAIANALNSSINNISIKATTEEGLGFTGQGEAMAAHAVCLLVQKGVEHEAL